jgi:disulfide bond formation protein DsbB
MNSSTIQAEVINNELEDAHTTWIDSLTELLGASSRHIALLAAWIATSGSLFFSEVLGWRPCVLCWYQRILMYPLAVLLAIGIIRRDRALSAYVLPFSIAGIGVSLYHYLLIKTDWLSPPACALDVPCNVDYLNIFGFINIPFLALTAFLIITCMMLAEVWTTSADVDERDIAVDDEQTAVNRASITNSTLAVVMIVVSVVLLFLVGSTFV